MKKYEPEARRTRRREDINGGKKRWNFFFLSSSSLIRKTLTDQKEAALLLSLFIIFLLFQEYTQLWPYHKYKHTWRWFHCVYPKANSTSTYRINMKYTPSSSLLLCSAVAAAAAAGYNNSIVENIFSLWVLVHTECISQPRNWVIKKLWT